MKRLTALLLGLALVFTVACTACATSSSDAVAMAVTPLDAQDMRLGQCMAPVGYSVTPTLSVCGTDSAPRSVTNPLGLLVVAQSPDGKTVMTYESANTYIEIVSSTLNGYTMRSHQEGVFDTETMTPMARYMTPSEYALSYLGSMFPGVQMTYMSSLDLNRFDAALRRQAQKEYDEMQALHPEQYGLNIDWVELLAEAPVYLCNMNGEDYIVIVKTVVDATQTTTTVPMAQGTFVETEITWSPKCTYVLACPKTAPGELLFAFDAFTENTAASDQFNAANERLANELRQIVVDGRTSSASAYSYRVLGDSVSSGDSYSDERYTDYIYDQNDYTLSDGTHVKVSTAYDYVYEGDNGVVYFSDSAFTEPGTRLSPNR